MKRNLLLFAFILIAGWVSAQSISITTDGQAISGDANTLLTSHAKIHNNTSSALDVIVERTVNSLSTSHFSYFCWGTTCYPPGVSASPMPGETIAANDSNSSFIAYLNPASSIGVSSVTYCFINSNLPSDSACITFTYNATQTGIEELIAKGITLTGAYPNPADASAEIGYNLPAVQNAKLLVTNLLGSVVREIRLYEKQNIVTIPTSELKNGIYLYSLLNDDKVVTSKKLIVSHR